MSASDPSNDPPKMEEEFETTVVIQTSHTIGPIPNTGTGSTPGGGGGGGFSTGSGDGSPSAADAAAAQAAFEAAAQAAAEAKAQAEADAKAKAEAEAQAAAEAKALQNAQEAALAAAQHQPEIGGSKDGYYVFSTRAPTTPAEIAIAARLRIGQGTPEEALRWFQRDYPGLMSLPKWNSDRGFWEFAGIHEPGALTTDDVSSGSVEKVASPPVSQGPSPGSPASSTSGVIGFASAGDGRSAGLPGTADGSPSRASGGTSSGSSPAGGSAPARVASAPPLNNPLKPPPIVSPGLVPPRSTFADAQVRGAIQDAIDKNNPWLARLILNQVLPYAYLAQILESQVVNPLLAAPYDLYEAALYFQRAEEFTAGGEYLFAIDDMNSAEGKVRSAALAIAAVIPFGAGAAQPAAKATLTAEQLAARGVEYVTPRVITREAGVQWALHQEWVTGSIYEHVFSLDGRLVYVDGFISKSGQRVLQTAADTVLLEVKMANKIDLIQHSAPDAEIFVRQLENYIELGRRLEAGGVRYAITEAAEGTPATSALTRFMMERYPDLMRSGWLEAVAVSPPPPKFMGL